MDRTGWIAVITCSILLVAWMFVGPILFPPPPAPVTPPPTTTSPEGTDPSTTTPDTTQPEVTAEPAVAEEIVEMKSDPGEDKGVLFRFTNKGGGVLTADLLEHTVTLDGEEKVRLNDFKRRPIGSLVTGAEGPRAKDLLTYAVEKQTETEIIYVATRPDGIEVRKRYYLNRGAKAEEGHEDSESHLLHCEVTLTNPVGESRQATDLSDYWFYGGSIAPMLPRGMMYTGFYYKDGKMKYKGAGFFRGGWFSSPRADYITETRKELNWAGASNQFFAMVIRDPAKESSAFWVSPFDMVIKDYEEQSVKRKTKGLECAMALPDRLLEPGQSTTVKYDIYLGPKEFNRLRQLPDGQKDLMAYGNIPIMGFFFGWIIKPFSELLVIVLVFLHGMVGNFGVAILMLTVLVRLLIWPVHSKAHSVSKQMSQLTPKIQALKEKYPDDPQKLQQEQMRLWSEYGINPMGGCLPAFIQLPIFLGYFRMLSSAAELRHEPFMLWINDLSMPDTVWHNMLGTTWDLNLLPIIMTATSYLQFSLMPKTGDKNQQMIFKFMPLMFLLFCYTYASALALYWTWQNIISIGQTYLLNKKAIPELKKRPKKKGGKKSFFEKLQEQAEAAKAAQEQQRKSGGSGGGGGAAKKKSAPTLGNLPGAGARGGNTGSTNLNERGPRKQKPRGKGKGGKKRKRR